MADTLEGSLAHIPGLTEYLAMKRYLGDQAQREQSQEQQRQFIQERANLGAGAGTQDIVDLALRHTTDPTATLHYGSIEAANKQKYEYFNSLLESKLQNINQTHEYNMRRVQDAETKTLLTKGKNDAEAEVNRMKAELDRMYKMTRLSIEQQKVNQGSKPPAGYRQTAEGNLEAIPGGPADVKVQGQFNQDTAILNGTQADLDRLAREAQRLLNHPGLSKTTGIMSAVPGVGGLATIPGTDAANFKAGLETLKSETGINVLQNMRNNSKTGGALGQVSDFENRMLQANLGSLDRAQSEPEFRASLQKIIKYTDEAKDRLRAAYNLKHGAKQPAGSPGGGWSIRQVP